MEYITAEQFLEQDKEVQKVFLDWWKPQENDTYRELETKTNYLVAECQNCDEIWNSLKLTDKSIIPLLTEGQLRKFIEDKTGFPIQVIEFTDKHKEYEIMTEHKTINKHRDFRIHSRLGINLLQAYWKVALEIARGEMDG